MNGVLVDMGVDTQASVNCLSAETFDKWQNKPVLSEDVVETYAFCGEKPLKSRGKFEAELRANGRVVKSDVHVFEGVRDNLLGFKACVGLG